MESIVFLHDILWQIYLCETKCCCWTLSIVFLDMTSFSQISLWQLSIELHSLAPTPSWSTQIYIYFWWWKQPFEIQVLNFYHKDCNEFPSYIQEKDHTVPKRIFLAMFFSILFSLRFLPRQGVFFNCSSQFSVPKWKTMSSQPEILFHEIFDVQKILVGWTTFFFLALKFGRNS